MTLTYILVDFDNVKPSAADIALARGEGTRLAVVRGPQQTRYEPDLAEALHESGEVENFWGRPVRPKIVKEVSMTICSIRRASGIRI